jgi:hypothetical protein
MRNFYAALADIPETLPHLVMVKVEDLVESRILMLEPFG